MENNTLLSLLWYNTKDVGWIVEAGCLWWAIVVEVFSLVCLFSYFLVEELCLGSSVSYQLCLMLLTKATTHTKVDRL